jgi:hypothetical protein
LAELDPGETARKLTSKFGFDSAHGSNHDRYKLVIDNTYVASVDLARHKEPYRDELISRMAKQLGVGGRVFRDMIECTVDNAAFLAMKGVMPVTQELTSLDRGAAGVPALEPAPRALPAAKGRKTGRGKR